jgi:signal transduction histidine kinase
MSKVLRVLVCEDNEDDYELLVLELRRSGYQPETIRVQSALEVRTALKQSWDIVFSDWSMPSFTAPEALEIVRETGVDIPFVIVSGTVGEEAAVEALRRGAHDFLVKGRLTRLPVVIEREMREASRRRERGRMQEQLMISDRMASVGVLAAGVAHEINNPLAAVIANLDLAISDLEGVEISQDVREELADARAAAERVRHIVRDLRIFSRTEEEHRGPVDVQAVMESTIRMASNEIRHRARLVKEFHPVGTIDASEARIGQVFLNLLVNAAQALPEGRADQNEIRVRIDRDPSQIRISISDTGPGIDPSAMARLFTPFYTTKPAGIGTGLGLSICHRLVTSFGGRIEVANNPDRGATFTVFLPFGESDSAETETRPLPLMHAVRRGRVLIVDDEPMVGRAVQRAIGGDHDTVYVPRGREALALIEAGQRFDVIVCDLMMPEMTGMDFHAELARVAPAQAAAIVFLTGGAFTPNSQQFLDAIENERIEKPFQASYLRAVINMRVK